MFDVPRVGDDPTVLVSDLECSRSEYLVHDERPLPWGREFVSILAALNSSEDQIPDLELAGAYVTLVVASGLIDTWQSA
jgi:hypothetical protein